MIKKEKELSLLLIALNKGVGHNIPTGARNSKLFLHTTITDRSGKVLSAKKVELGGEDYPPLFPGRDTYYRVDIPFSKKGEFNLEISLRFEEKGRKGEGGVVIYKEVLPVEKGGCAGCPLDEGQ